MSQIPARRQAVTCGEKDGTYLTCLASLYEFGCIVHAVIIKKPEVVPKPQDYASAHGMQQRPTSKLGAVLDEGQAELITGSQGRSVSSAPFAQLMSEPGMKSAGV